MVRIVGYLSCMLLVFCNLCFLTGTVKKLLHQIGQERGIRIDEVKFDLPITSMDSVSCS